MAVLFAEGFTGATRGTYQMLAALQPLPYLGWAISGWYNNNQGMSSATTNQNLNILADDIFADRNKLVMSGLLSSGVSSYVMQIKKPLDTRGYQKFVIGMMVTPNSSATTNGTSWQVIVGGPTVWTSSTANLPSAEFFAQIISGDSPTADGQLNMFGALQASTPLIKKGKAVHVEILIEQDTDRCRVYLDGVLTGDATYSGTFAAENGGFSVAMYSGAASVRTVTADISNIYVLGIDSVHTGILGPAARVLEIVPPGDMDVSWVRPDSYATNAEVLAQTFDKQSPDFLAASKVGDYDVYNAPNAVAANAVQVFGAGIKINAMTMAPGTHTIKPVVKTASGVTEIGTEAVLPLGTLTSIFVDASKNPDTGTVWTPSAVSAAGFGMKLKS